MAGAHRHAGKPELRVGRDGDHVGGVRDDPAEPVGPAREEPGPGAEQVALEKSMNDVYCRRSDSSNSPMARITKNSINADDGVDEHDGRPGQLMVLPEPMNRPVPMAPPMAMSWMWWLVRPAQVFLPCVRLASEGTSGSWQRPSWKERMNRHRHLVSTRPKSRRAAAPQQNTDERASSGEHKPKGKP